MTKRIVLILFLCVLLAACRTALNTGTNLPAVIPSDTPEEIPTVLADSSPMVSPVSEEEEFQVITQPNALDETKTDVLIRNTISGEEKLFITLDNIYREHYHNGEYHGGNLYIIKRIGDPGAADAEWSDELWRYDAQASGKMLISKKGLDFRAAPNETAIAIHYNETGGNLLAFINTNGDVLQEFKNVGGDYANSPQKWSDDGSIYWGALTMGPVPTSFYKVSVAAWQMSIYDLSQLKIGDEYDLNANTASLVYSDYPVMFDADTAQNFKNSGKAVTLFFYDLNSHVKQIIATSITKAFKPSWLDDKTIEYDDPNGEGRVLFIFP